MTGLKRPLRPPDWSDAQTAPVRAGIPTARAAYEIALGQMPPWVNRAMKIRNGVVGRMGLKTPAMAPETAQRQLSDIDSPPEAPTPGMLHLPVVRERDDLYELGLEDRHLTFTLETRLEAGRAAMTTRIWFNHWTGRLYLAVVLIPHKIIVRHALGRLA
ncbi:DUF2867 domain-containing protein [Gymnodinialimonas ceratoperidinii]|uniref:DUF2867 domain-containing protein n=1 Tax=Gymnodinialimonas ceratoperidinii TaxID=2856823 RepID=A0A8F6TVZ9_9RHOB|nr:DUF2867 domain-containing protein [Gymnodinialimonas ceratoperidinii]QXT38924.1 DUF2867 domain-containing protein [Gymnodinialimonas ceratoperidinii]